MKRARRSSCTSGGTCGATSLAAAPSTGEYLNAPTRSSCASSSQSSNSSNSASVSPGKPTMKVLRIVRSGQVSRQRANALERFLHLAWAPHALEHRGAAVLERDVEIGQHLSLGHQRNHVVDMRIRIHVVHAHPDAELAQPARQVEETRFVFLPTPLGLAVTDVDAVSRGVLRDDQQLLDAGARELFAFAQHFVDGSAGQQAAHRRNDAEAALVVAALGDLEIRVVTRREPDALRRHQVDEGIVLRRQVLVHRAHHFFIGLRAGDLQHARMALENPLGPRAQAAGDDDLAVLLQRLADGVERLVHRRIDEAAGVHHHDVGGVVTRRDLVTLGAQPRDDAFGIHQGLGAPEADEPDFWLAAAHWGAVWYSPSRVFPARNQKNEQKLGVWGVHGSGRPRAVVRAPFSRVPGRLVHGRASS